MTRNVHVAAYINQLFYSLHVCYRMFTRSSFAALSGSIFPFYTWNEDEDWILNKEQKWSDPEQNFARMIVRFLWMILCLTCFMLVDWAVWLIQQIPLATDKWHSSWIQHCMNTISTDTCMEGIKDWSLSRAIWECDLWACQVASLWCERISSERHI